jgi:ATP synthase protein I
MDEDTKKTAIQMAYASSVGIAMVLAIFACLALGVYLDKKFDTGSLFTFIFLLIGIVAGFRNLHVLIQRYFTDDEPIIKSLKREPHRQRPAPKKN